MGVGGGGEGLSNLKSFSSFLDALYDSVGPKDVQNVGIRNFIAVFCRTCPLLP